MARYLMSLTDLGEENAWLLVQQARGIPDAKSRSDFMTERTAALIFLEDSFIERLCVSAAVRQMGGSLIYQGKGQWRQEMGDYQHELMCQMDYFVDCLYLYGFPATVWNKSHPENIGFPIINAGSPDGHPVHVLADVACMLKYSKGDISGVQVGWVGCNNGTLHSLVEGLRYFPYTLRVALPPLLDAAPLKEVARHNNVSVEFVATPEEAVQGADYIFAGCRSGLDEENAPRWEISSKLLHLAKPNARILLGSTPVQTVHVHNELLCNSPRSLLLLQAENRLRVHKRLLHWVFEESEKRI